MADEYLYISNEREECISNEREECIRDINVTVGGEQSCSIIGACVEKGLTWR